ncbi:hypothetical protein JCM13664_21970 [Methylothermus subterraneus]
MFVAAQVGGRWYFKTPAGWIEWDGTWEVPPYRSGSETDFSLETDFDPDALPPFEVYVGWGGSLREVVEQGHYERVLGNQDIPPAPDPNQCQSGHLCHTFRTAIEVVKHRFVSFNEMREESRNVVLLDGFFNGERLSAQDSEGCVYEGRFREVIMLGQRLGMYKTIEGVRVGGCADGERQGNYRTFFISYRQSFAQVLFTLSNLNPTQPGTYMVMGSGSFDL